MANPNKGEFPLTVGEQTFTLCFDVNQLCVCEGMLDMDASEITAKIGSGNLRLLRTVLWVGLQTHHKDVGMAEAGDLVTELGPAAVQEALIRGIAAAFPEPPKPDAKAKAGASEGGSRPRVRATAKA